ESGGVAPDGSSRPRHAARPTNANESATRDGKRCAMRAGCSAPASGSSAPRAAMRSAFPPFSAPPHLPAIKVPRGSTDTLFDVQEEVRAVDRACDLTPERLDERIHARRGDRGGDAARARGARGVPDHARLLRALGGGARAEPRDARPDGGR